VESPRILKLRNPVKSYAWGSRTAIPELLGEAASEVPQAELWMGAHPSAPSQVQVGEGELGLDAFVAGDPAAILGAGVAARHAGELPFLMKVLAADAPLSIQAHPSLAQAREGFARENAAGIALDAPQRNYRDANHKPELICALTRFVALDRFRAPDQVAERLGELEARDLEGALLALREGGLASFFQTLMTLDADARRRVLGKASRVAAGSSESALAWVARLVDAYPGDLGALAPLYLNLVELNPGEALYLPAGELHSYLGGVGLELMANSDNVLRGGLTAKHVDVPELMTTLSFAHGPLVPVQAERVSGCERLYPSPAAEFVLSVLEVHAGQSFESPLERDVEILLCTSGGCRLSERSGGLSLELQRGESVLLPAVLGGYRVEGEGVIYRAQVGAGSGTVDEAS